MCSPSFKTIHAGWSKVCLILNSHSSLRYLLVPKWRVLIKVYKILDLGGETRLCTGARNAGGAAAGLSVMDAVPLVSLLMERNSATV